MFPSFQKIKPIRDVPVGVIIALISIPISMGYAQIAGLPPVYGLYGSVLPILLFGLLTSSPRFVFGVDAAPAALVGALLATLGITPESAEAIAIVPVITLITAAWLLLFYLLRANRLLKYISAPVMGGFITGISTTIILMQLPKLFGGSAGVGEGVELLRHLTTEAAATFHPLSAALGIGTILVILLFKKLSPKLPMSVFLMLAGALLSRLVGLDALGVKLLPPVSTGLPLPRLPDWGLLISFFPSLAMPCLTIALVILSETLLATNNLGLAHGDRIQARREILAYTAGNLGAAVCGCCPVNGSVSRSGIADQFGVRSQLMSVAASVSMLLILLFGTGFIRYLPVPVLTGIVVSALIGTLEFHLAHKLRRADPIECFIFYAAFFSVLLFGTIYGVVVGVLLSSVTFIIRSSAPPADLLGYVESQDQFFPLARMRGAAPLEGVVLYRFTGALFYANIDRFQQDLEQAVKEDTRLIVVDSSGIGSVDITAAERLLLLYESFAARGISFYLAGHVGHVNDQLRELGAEALILRGAVKRTVPKALTAGGIHKPFPLAARAEPSSDRIFPSLDLTEYEWAFGTDAEQSLDVFARQMAQRLMAGDSFDAEQIHREELRFSDGYWTLEDEAQFLDLLELHLEEQLPEQEQKPHVKRIVQAVLERHLELERDLMDASDETLLLILRRRRGRSQRLRDHHPQLWQQVETERQRYRALRWERLPALAQRLEALEKTLDV
ncbi:MAG: SulP family inorganic anion transporter [Oscillospiraceae bacterium]|nr:SulP family inorganic anion transporter [Oscillospiraceae bacterium]